MKKIISLLVISITLSLLPVDLSIAQRNSEPGAESKGPASFVGENHLIGKIAVDRQGEVLGEVVGLVYGYGGSVNEVIIASEGVEEQRQLRSVPWESIRIFSQ